MDVRPVDWFTPLHIETDLPRLEVFGDLPRGLCGTLYRNGPSPHFPTRDHLFAGDGMVHAFVLGEGKASYRNRWVRTDKWMAEDRAGHALVGGFGGPSAAGADVPRTGVANTNVIWHGARLLALEEAHLPFELDPATLATRGVQDFAGGWRGPFTAHPKTDPRTGELIAFAYNTDLTLSPAMQYGTLSADGRVTRFEPFDAPYCSMVHDFAVTDRHVLFPVLPLAGLRERAKAGQMPYAWKPELGGHVGLIRRDAGVASLRWFAVPPCYVFHVMNAWDAPDGRIVVDVIQFAAAPLFPHADGGAADPAAERGYLARWTIDPAADTDMVAVEILEDIPGEFPRCDERRAGLPYRYGVFSAGITDIDAFDGLVWRDLQAGRHERYALPRGDGMSEAVFVPRAPDAPEGDGWLLAMAFRAAEGRTDLLVFDTSAVSAGPVATVKLPHHVPFGFHGNWVDATGRMS